MIPAASIVLLFCAALPPFAPSQQVAEPRQGDAVAVVNGEPLGRQAFHAFVGYELQHESRAQDVLELMIQQQVIEAEARQKGLLVTDQEIEERLRQLDAETARQTEGKRSLAVLFQQLGVAREQFLPAFRATLLAEQLVRAEFEMPPGSEVPYEKTNLWIQDRMQRAVIQRTGLPAEILVVVDGSPVAAADLGRRYLLDQQSRRSELLTEFMDTHILCQAAAEEGLVLDRADIENAVRERRQRLRSDPRYAGATLEELLAKTGLSVDWLGRSTRFRNQVLLDLMVEARYPDDRLRRYYERNIEEFDRQYGPAVRLRVIFLRAGHEGATVHGFVPRLFEDAEAELSALAERISQGKATFEEVARARSEHQSKASGGDIGFVTSSDPTLGKLAEAALDSEADGAPIGPILTAEGAWLILVCDRRPKPAFEEIREHVVRHAANSLFRDLRDKADIVVDG